MKKDFVTFYWPGAIVAETSESPIDSWNVEEAINMARKNKTLPYGFIFTTRERNENDLDSHESKKSGIYYLGGDVLTLKDVKSRNNPDDKILISNMECNHWDKIVVNTNSWTWTQPLKKDDIVLDFKI